MRINLSTAEGDVVLSAYLCALFADVISAAQKREMMSRLGALKETLDCPPGGCGGCPRLRACEEAVQDIMAS